MADFQPVLHRVLRKLAGALGVGVALADDGVRSCVPDAARGDAYRIALADGPLALIGGDEGRGRGRRTQHRRNSRCWRHVGFSMWWRELGGGLQHRRGTGVALDLAIIGGVDDGAGVAEGSIPLRRVPCVLGG